MQEDIEVLDEVRYKDLVADVKKKGWVYHRSSASHDIYKHPRAKHHLSIPNHPKDIPTGTLKQIQRKSMILEDGVASAVPAVNTQSTGEAEIAANPPVSKKKKTNLFTRTPGVPRTLRQIISKEK